MVARTRDRGCSRCSRGSTSDRQAGAAFAAAGRQDGPAGAGPHAQSETVLLVPATVVRLVRALHMGVPSKAFDARGARNWPPSTTAVNDAGSRQGPAPTAYVTRPDSRHPHASYTATRRFGPPTRRHPADRTADLCTIGCQEKAIGLPSAQRTKQRFPALVVRPEAFHMGYPHCGELVFRQSLREPMWMS